MATNDGESNKVFDEKDRTERYLDKLYDHTKQLTTLSTASAVIFISLYDGNLTARDLLWPLLALALSALFSTLALTLVTRMIGSGKAYEPGFSASDAKGKWLWVCHVGAVVTLLAGVVWFGLRTL